MVGLLICEVANYRNSKHPGLLMSSVGPSQSPAFQRPVA